MFVVLLFLVKSLQSWTKCIFLKWFSCLFVAYILFNEYCFEIRILVLTSQFVDSLIKDIKQWLER